MTPEQALALLDRVVANVPASRKEHGMIAEALQVLLKAISKVPSEPVDSGPKD